MDPCDSKSSEGDFIRILLRVRPPDADFDPQVLDVNLTDNTITVRTKPEPQLFHFSKVADADITQEAVFSIVGKNLTECFVSGYNGTIMAYGQTGSGKTFSMFGPPETLEIFQHELRGVIPRSLEFMFGLIAHQQKLSGYKKQFLCSCSCVEVYQEQIFDLFDTASRRLHLRENKNKGLFLEGVIEHDISNARDAYQEIIKAYWNRRVAATSMNRAGSRSHAVFTVRIQSTEDVNGLQHFCKSHLRFVDLAGSERQKDANTGGTCLKEAANINKSLSVLGNVIIHLVAVSHGKKRHIPYRDSKLTLLLRDSLGKNAKTRIIACVHPDSRCLSETISTLKFARKAKCLKNKAVVNEEIHGNKQKLQTEILRLRKLVEESMQISPGPEIRLNANTTLDTNDCSASGSISLDGLSATALEKHRGDINENQEQMENVITPSASAQDQALKEMPDMHEMGILLKNLAGEACEDEKKMLQMENGILQERIDKCKTDMLRQKELIEKLERFNSQLSCALEKEKQNNFRLNDHSIVKLLQEEIATQREYIKVLRDEKTALKSANKKLKEDDERQKALLHKYTQDIQNLETQLSETTKDLEKTTREKEKAIEELGALKLDLMEECDSEIDEDIIFLEEEVEWLPTGPEERRGRRGRRNTDLLFQAAQKEEKCQIGKEGSPQQLRRSSRLKSKSTDELKKSRESDLKIQIINLQHQLQMITREMNSNRSFHKKMESDKKTNELAELKSLTCIASLTHEMYTPEKPDWTERINPKH